MIKKQLSILFKNQNTFMKYDIIRSIRLFYQSVTPQKALHTHKVSA